MYQTLFAFVKNPRIFAPILLLATTGTAFLGLHTRAPLFATTDPFVLFATEGVTLEENTQVSSGNIGTNGDLTFRKNILISGDLFVDKLTLDKGVSVNGNASYNKLHDTAEAQILGTKTKPVSLPIANLSMFTDFAIGATSLTVTGTSTILAPNNYRDITLSKGSTLTLSSGTYTLHSLELKDGSTLIFTGTTTLNIQRALKGEHHVSILPAANTQHDQLTINYNGFKEKNTKTRDHFDDDKDASDAFDNDNERKDWQKGKSAQPIVFGERAFLNFRLIAPKASVTIGRESIVRGQGVAGKIRIKKDSVVSREATFTYTTKSDDIITDPAGGVYPINELLLHLSPTSTPRDAETIANLVGGVVVGNISSINLYQITVPTSGIAQLEALMAILNNSHHPALEGVTRNFVALPNASYPISEYKVLVAIDEIGIATFQEMIHQPPLLVVLVVALTLLILLMYAKRQATSQLVVPLFRSLFYSKKHFYIFLCVALFSVIAPALVIFVATLLLGGDIFSPILSMSDVWELDLFGSPFDFRSIIGTVGNLLFWYVFIGSGYYAVRCYNLKHRIRSASALLLLLIVLVFGIIVMFVRYKEIARPSDYNPSDMHLTNPNLHSFMFDFVYAQTQTTTDLENLRHQDAELVKAYDIIHLEETWARIPLELVSTAMVKIGIVDTGIDATHPEFNNPTVNLGSLRRGILRDLDAPEGHGTQVAGIIGANNVSRTGTLPSGSPQMNGILSGVLREDQYVLDIKPYGGPPNVAMSTMINIGASLESAIRQNPDVLNMSFGLPLCSALSGAKKKCIKTNQEFLDNFRLYRKLFAQSTNTLFVSSAGNEGIDSTFSLPGILGGILSNFITVGATDNDDHRALFDGGEESNFGSAVSVSAPGIGIYAPEPKNLYSNPEAIFFPTFSGTSAAAPMVTGVAGLLKAIKPLLTPTELKTILTKTVNTDPITTTPDKPIGRRLNALKAVCDPQVLNCPTSSPFVIHAASDVQFFNDNVSRGEIKSNFVLLDTNNVHHGDVITNGLVSVGTNNLIDGDVGYNFLELRPPGTIPTITGIIATPIPPPHISIPVIPQFPSATTTTTITADTTLPPGNYGNLIVDGGATLTILDGVYNFDELFFLNFGTSLRFSAGSIVNVNGIFNASVNVTILPTINDSPTRLSLNTGEQIGFGTGNTVSVDSRTRGVLVMSNDNVVTGNMSGLDIFAFFNNRINVPPLPQLRLQRSAPRTYPTSTTPPLDTLNWMESNMMTTLEGHNIATTTRVQIIRGFQDARAVLGNNP